MRLFGNKNALTEEFNEAVDLLQKDETKGFQAMLIVAEKGFPYAQNNVGVCYTNGIGVAKDDATAFYWFEKASKKGEEMSCLNLAQFYMTGTGCKTDLKKAMSLCLKVIKYDGEYKEAASEILENVKKQMNAEDAKKEIDAYINSSNKKYRRNDIQGGIKDLEAAMAINPNLWYLYYNRGIGKSNIADYLGAKKDFDKAIELNPSCPELYHARGHMRYNLGDADYMEDIKKSKRLEKNK